MVGCTVSWSGSSAVGVALLINGGEMLVPVNKALLCSLIEIEWGSKRGATVPSGVVTVIGLAGAW